MDRATEWTDDMVKMVRILKWRNDCVKGLTGKYDAAKWHRQPKVPLYQM